MKRMHWLVWKEVMTVTPVVHKTKYATRMEAAVLAAAKADIARAVNAKAEALTTAAVSDVLSPG